jgi:hypothetical protein
MLRQEFETLQTVHASTESLFKQLALPMDFSQRVMRRLQDNDVPADASSDSVRLPVVRAQGRRASVVKVHRTRARIYAIVASVSAAAAVLLSVGILTGFFARAGIGTQQPEPIVADETKSDPNNKNVADGRRGGPDREDLNRTGSSTRQPQQPDVLPPLPRDPREEGGTTEVSGPDVPGETRPETPVVPDKGQPTDVVEGDNPAPAPDTPEGKGDVVEEDNPSKVVPDSPEGVVEEPERRTEVIAADRDPIGRVLVLNGWAELLNERNEATRMTDDQIIFIGDRLRTSVNGTAMLNTDAGTVTMYRSGEVVVSDDNEFEIKKGVVSLDRGSMDAGAGLSVKADDYTFLLNHGCAVIERKRQGILISKCVGFGSLAQDGFDTVLFEGTTGLELEAEFGKAAGEPKAKQINLPGWSAEARARTVLLSIGEALASRNYSIRDRKFIDSNLPKRLEKLLVYPVGTDSVVTFLMNAVGNDKLESRALIDMVGEVEVAYLKIADLTPEAITLHAASAAFAAESYANWLERFYGLVQPQPADAGQPRPAGSSTTTECPNAKPKLKRVSNPPPRRTVRRTGSGDSADPGKPANPTPPTSGPTTKTSE